MSPGALPVPARPGPRGGWLPAKRFLINHMLPRRYKGERGRGGGSARPRSAPPLLPSRPLRPALVLQQPPCPASEPRYGGPSCYPRPRRPPPQPGAGCHLCGVPAGAAAPVVPVPSWWVPSSGGPGFRRGMLQPLLGWLCQPRTRGVKPRLQPRSPAPASPRFPVTAWEGPGSSPGRSPSPAPFPAGGCCSPGSIPGPAR